MVLCQDCGDNEATHIILEKDSNKWFLVCEDCIDLDKDLVCDYSIQQISKKLTE